MSGPRFGRRPRRLGPRRAPARRPGASGRRAPSTETSDSKQRFPRERLATPHRFHPRYRSRGSTRSRRAGTWRPGERRRGRACSCRASTSTPRSWASCRPRPRGERRRRPSAKAAPPGDSRPGPGARSWQRSHPRCSETRPLTPSAMPRRLRRRVVEPAWAAQRAEPPAEFLQGGGSPVPAGPERRAERARRVGLGCLTPPRAADTRESDLGLQSDGPSIMPTPRSCDGSPSPIPMVPGPGARDPLRPVGVVPATSVVRYAYWRIRSTGCARSRPGLAIGCRRPPEVDRPRPRAGPIARRRPRSQQGRPGPLGRGGDASPPADTPGPVLGRLRDGFPDYPGPQTMPISVPISMGGRLGGTGPGSITSSPAAEHHPRMMSTGAGGGTAGAVPQPE
jgi:hypothetical protein